MMRRIDLEAWVLKIVDQVVRKQPTEDSHVELKSKWPPADDTYRPLAAHANAAFGEPILWIVGLDEKAGIVVGADNNDLANWLPQLHARFDQDVSPTLLISLNVPVGDKTVVALLFETDRAPYVVKAGPGQVQREVPWRYGNGTQTARRSELIRMLAPIVRVPAARFVSSRMTIQSKPKQQNAEWHFEGRLYIVHSGATASIPGYACRGQFTDGAALNNRPFDHISLFTYPTRSHTSVSSSGSYTTTEPTTKMVVSDGSQLTVSGSGMAHVSAWAPVENNDAFRAAAELEVGFRLPVAEADYAPVIVSARLKRAGTGAESIWEQESATF